MPAQIEGEEVGAQPGRQARHQPRHRIWIGIDQQRVNGAAARPQSRHKGRRAGGITGEMPGGDGGEAAAVGGIGQAVGIAQGELPFADGRRRPAGPWLPRPGPGAAGGEISQRLDQVVIAADADQQAHRRRRRRIERGDDRRPHRIRSGDDDHAGGGSGAGVVDNGIGHGIGIGRAQAQRLPGCQLRHQHAEAGAPQRVGGGHDAGVVLAVRRRPRHQHQCGTAAGGLVEVGQPPPPRHHIGDLGARCARRLAPAGGTKIGQQAQILAARAADAPRQGQREGQQQHHPGRVGAPFHPLAPPSPERPV